MIWLRNHKDNEASRNLNVLGHSAIVDISSAPRHEAYRVLGDPEIVRVVKELRETASDGQQ